MSPQEARMSAEPAMPVDPARPRKTSRPATKGPRRTDRITTMWMILALVLLGVSISTRGAVPQLWWTSIHLVALGVLTNGIMQWSWFFTRSMLRLAPDDRHAGKDARTRVLILNAAFVLLILAMWRSHAVATVALAAVVGGVIAWHGLALMSALRSALASRFAVVVRFYIAASACLVVGCALAGIITTAMFAQDAPQWVIDQRDQWTVAHALVNVGGWVGLSIAGTLITFGPTVLRTKMNPQAPGRAVKALPYALIALGVGAVGAATNTMWLYGAGLFAYLAVLVVGIAPGLVGSARVRLPQEHAARTIAFGLGWLLLCATSLAVLAVSSTDAASLRSAVEPWVGVAGAGIAQIFIGSLSYLLPVVVGGGPAVVKVGIRTLELASPLRLAIRNTAVLFIAAALLTDRPVAAWWWYAVVVTFAVEIALLAVAGARQSKQRRLAMGGEMLPFPIAAKIPPGTPPAEAARAMFDGLRAKPGGAVAGVLAVLLVSVAFSSSGVPASGSSNQAGAGVAPAAVEPTGNVTTVVVSVQGMQFVPDEIEVPAGNELIVTFHNTGDQRHDLVFSNGVKTASIAPGASAEISVGVIGGDLQGWCSLVGHRAMGMELTVLAQGGSTLPENTATDPGTEHDHHAHAGQGFFSMSDLLNEAHQHDPYPAAVPPATEQTVHEYEFVVTEEYDQVTKEVSRAVWTYNGTSPGPVLRGKVGDTFRITLVNNGTMGHSIDFHAGELAPNGPMRTIDPGESLTYEFVAERSGIWMYHCSTMPMSQHIANGMFGAVIIDPTGLSQVDQEFILIQSEMYVGADGQAADPTLLASVRPNVVAFNGRAFQYDAHPLQVAVGERIRVWLLNVGPNISSAFHVVGSQFDTVWGEGAYSVFQGRSTDGITAGITGSQVVPLLAAEGGFVEFVLKEEGSYPFVNHQMSHAEMGAHGVFLAVAAE